MDDGLGIKPREWGASPCSPDDPYNGRRCSTHPPTVDAGAEAKLLQPLSHVEF